MWIDSDEDAPLVTYPLQPASLAPGAPGQILATSSGTAAWAGLTDVGAVPAAGGTMTGPLTLTGMAAGYSARTAGHTFGPDDHTVHATAGTWTLRLPGAAGTAGKVYRAKNTGSGVITVAPTGADLIDGSPAVTLHRWDALTVQSTGDGWIIL
jgi:hypothetical protein